MAAWLYGGFACVIPRSRACFAAKLFDSELDDFCWSGSSECKIFKQAGLTLIIVVVQRHISVLELNIPTISEERVGVRSDKRST
jgi:hypothetical protein